MGVFPIDIACLTFNSIVDQHNEKIYPILIVCFTFQFYSRLANDQRFSIWFRSSLCLSILQQISLGLCHFRENGRICRLSILQQISIFKFMQPSLRTYLSFNSIVDQPTFFAYSSPFLEYSTFNSIVDQLLLVSYKGIRYLMNFQFYSRLALLGGVLFDYPPLETFNSIVDQPGIFPTLLPPLKGSLSILQQIS